MAVVAEYTTKLQADLAVALLWDSGVEGTILSDPAHSVAPHHVTDPMFLVVVRKEVADEARDVLLEEAMSEGEADLVYEHKPLESRPALFRWAAWALFWAIPGAFIVAILLLIWFLLGALFP